MVTKEQIEQAMESISQKTLKALSERLGLSVQGAILALRRTGLRESYDFSANHGVNLLEPWNKGKKMSQEYCDSLSMLRKGRNKLPRGFRKCPECGKEYEIVVGAKNKSKNRTYCSQECKNLAHSHRQTTGEHLQTRACEFCGKPVEKQPSLFNEHCFCSYSCANSWRKGKSYEELFGEERALIIKEKIAKTTEERNSNPRYVSKLHLRVKEEMLRQGITGFLTSQRYSYFELDEYNPDLALVVEIDGEYWHRSKQEQDQRKDSFLKNRGLQVIRLKEKCINDNIAREVAKIKEMVNAKITN